MRVSTGSASGQMPDRPRGTRDFGFIERVKGDLEDAIVARALVQRLIHVSDEIARQLKVVLNHDDSVEARKHIADASNHRSEMAAVYFAEIVFRHFVQQILSHYPSSLDINSLKLAAWSFAINKDRTSHETPADHQGLQSIAQLIGTPVSEDGNWGGWSG